MVMMASSREGYQAKQEGDTTIDIDKYSRFIPSTSRQWSAFRNPRIVRVSRSFGGKDRHSKVCTIRGLRDRRIRLSVPTAVQLYELQDKLGLSQPSKVIDWLLEATKLDIDKLPPLQFPQGFSQFHHQQTLWPHHHESISASSHQLSLGAFYDANSTFIRDGAHQNLMPKPSRFWDMDSISSRLKGKEASERGYVSEKGKWIIKTNEQEENQDGGGVGGYDHSSSQVSTQRLFPMGATTTTTHPTLHGLLNINNGMSYSSSYHSEPSSLSLSQFGSHGLFPSQQLDPHPIGGNGVQFASSLQVLPSGSQLFFGPSSATPPPLFSPYAPFVTTSSVENNDPIPRQFNHIHQFLNSSSQVLPHYIPSLHHSFNTPVRPFPVPFSSKLLESDDNNNNNNNNNPSQSDYKGSTHS